MRPTVYLHVVMSWSEPLLLHQKGEYLCCISSKPEAPKSGEMTLIGKKHVFIDFPA